MDLISALQFLRLNDVPEGKTLLSVIEMWFTEHPAVWRLVVNGAVSWVIEPRDVP